MEAKDFPDDLLVLIEKQLKLLMPEKVCRVAVSLSLRCTKGPHRFAVRSSGLSEDSAQFSFAGIHDSFLNVDPDTEIVVEKIKECWASCR